MTLVSPVRFQERERPYGEGNGRHEGLSFVAGLYGEVRVRNTVELFPHGGNGCVDSVDVVCCGTVCLASDNGLYVNLLAHAGRPRVR